MTDEMHRLLRALAKTMLDFADQEDIRSGLTPSDSSAAASSQLGRKPRAKAEPLPFVAAPVAEPLPEPAQPDPTALAEQEIERQAFAQQVASSEPVASATPNQDAQQEDEVAYLTQQIEAVQSFDEAQQTESRLRTRMGLLGNARPELARPLFETLRQKMIDFAPAPAAADVEPDEAPAPEPEPITVEAARKALAGIKAVLDKQAPENRTKAIATLKDRNAVNLGRIQFHQPEVWNEIRAVLG